MPQTAAPLRYRKLNKEIQEQIEHDRANHINNPYKANDNGAVRRDPDGINHLFSARPT